MSIPETNNDIQILATLTSQNYAICKYSVHLCIEIKHVAFLDYWTWFNDALYILIPSFYYLIVLL